MTLTDVQIAYQQIVNQVPPSTPFLFIIVIFLLISIIPFLAIVSFNVMMTMLEGRHTWKRATKGWEVILICCLIVAAPLTKYIAAVKEQKQNQAYIQQLYSDIQRWKVDMAEPYIASLPQEKRKLVYLKMDAVSQTQTEGLLRWGTGHLSSSTNVQPLMILSYQDGGKVVTRTEQAPIQVDLVAGANVSVTYVVLHEPIGVISAEKAEELQELVRNHFDSSDAEKWMIPAVQIAAGSYHYMVHVPAGYTFTSR